MTNLESVHAFPVYPNTLVCIYNYRIRVSSRKPFVNLCSSRLLRSRASYFQHPRWMTLTTTAILRSPMLRRSTTSNSTKTTTSAIPPTRRTQDRQMDRQIVRKTISRRSQQVPRTQQGVFSLTGLAPREAAMTHYTIVILSSPMA